MNAHDGFRSGTCSISAKCTRSTFPTELRMTMADSCHFYGHSRPAKNIGAVADDLPSEFYHHASLASTVVSMHQQGPSRSIKKQACRPHTGPFRNPFCTASDPKQNKETNFNVRVQDRKSKRLIGRPCGDGVAQLIIPLAHRTDESILKTTRIPVTFS